MTTYRDSRKTSTTTAAAVPIRITATFLPDGKSPVPPADNSPKLVWGRTGPGRSWFGSLIASAPVILAPLTSITTFTVLHGFEGSFSAYYVAVAEKGFWTVCVKYGPRLTWEGVAAVACWVGFQALLSLCLPGKIGKGQVTPAGHVLAYRLNGLSSWILTHLVYFALSWFGLIDPAFIARNRSSPIAAMNLAGLLAPTVAFVKAYVSPTHPDDRKFSSTFPPVHSFKLTHSLTLFFPSLSLAQTHPYMTFTWVSN